MVYNALAGALAGQVFGLTDHEIKAGIEALTPVGGRNHIFQSGSYTIIDDCYNANPVSMRASIDVVCRADGRSVCILGDMFELGENEKQLHYETGQYLGRQAVDVLITVGSLSRNLPEERRKPDRNTDWKSTAFIHWMNCSANWNKPHC
ncbi:MAG: glutamate ligase domain-containing protein [Lachnospiraceae bacterium]